VQVAAGGVLSQRLRRRSLATRRRSASRSRTRLLCMACRSLALRSRGRGSGSIARGQGGEAGRELAGDLRDGARRGDDGDEAALIALTAEALDAVARREEGVEALDECRVTAEEGRDAIDDAGCIDAVRTRPKRIS
jgi:hypothetical protein